jgi:hypothetical protein
VVAKWMGDLDEERARIVLGGEIDPESIESRLS